MEDAADGGGRGPATAVAAAPGGVAPGGGLSGYIVDLSCAKRGKGMWNNAECVARCVRDGDKVVLVTEEGKIFQISNQDKITPESYGQVVTLTGKTDGDTITVESLKVVRLLQGRRWGSRFYNSLASSRGCTGPFTRRTRACDASIDSVVWSRWSPAR